MTQKTFLVGVLIAGAVGVAQVLMAWDPAEVLDWRSWAISLVGAFVRPAAAYVVSSGVVQRLIGRAPSP